MESDKLASSYENLRNDYIMSTMLDFKKKNRKRSLKKSNPEQIPTKEDVIFQKLEEV